MRAADFGTRFSAFVIDATLLFVAQWVIFIVSSRQLQAVGLSDSGPCDADPTRICDGPSTGLWALLLSFLVVTTVGYYAVLEGRYGATPGKRWLGLEVVGIDGSRPIGVASALVRAVVRQAFWLVLFFLVDASPISISVPSVLFILLPLAAIAGVAMGAVAPDGRAAHDRLAGTLVVRSDELAPQGDHRNLV